MNKSIILKIILLTLIPLLAFLPIFLQPSLLVNRNNDLTEFFWPIFYYLKQNILIAHHIPYLNEVFFAGTPLLPDPQNPLWYLPNVIFLFLNIDLGIIISLFLHFIMASFSGYFLFRKVFRFSKTTSYFLTFIFIFSSQLFSFLEAGHWGLVISYCWMPLLFLSTYYLASKPSLKYVLIFSLAASSIYFNHVLTALLVAMPVLVFWVYKKAFKFTFIAVVLTLVFISPAVWYQSHWIPQTTRSFLLEKPETFPVWMGKKEFVKSLFVFNPQTEKAVTVGLFPGILAFVGFLKIKRKSKIFVLVILATSTLIILNNVSPILSLLLKINFYILMRVATRIWFLIFFILLFLIGLGLEKINKKIKVVLITLSLVESLSLSYSYFRKPISVRENIPQEIYDAFSQDTTNFRVLCLTHCIPQKEAALRNIHLVEGYGTLQSKNYYFGLQNALNTTWSGYSLVIPPYDVYQYQNIQPNPKLLLNYNTKYIISKNVLHDKAFVLVGNYKTFYLYKNKLWQ